eukprot:TRINITY_DN25495_c0_g2_i10.p1 TRINITY_DN25495_c0_g2~~TRINITY_DN25495_c0_g2_i10.p1  ORF type:complete len:258 (+),score=72.32 TRINITY_DN25495_c0_g2_i10:670-1443(+)
MAKKVSNMQHAAGRAIDISGMDLEEGANQSCDILERAEELSRFLRGQGRVEDAALMEELAEKERADREHQKTRQSGVTAVQNAVIRGELNSVKGLLGSGLSAELTDANGDTLFMLAAAHGRLQVAQYLHRAHRVDINARNNRNGTALTLATKYFHSPLHRWLLTLDGVEVDAQCDGGRTALMDAARSNRTDMVKRLLKADADPELQNEQGQTALDLAIENHCTRASELLQFHNACADGFDHDLLIEDVDTAAQGVAV